eukprot:342518_1
MSTKRPNRKERASKYNIERAKHLAKHTKERYCHKGHYTSNNQKRGWEKRVQVNNDIKEKRQAGALTTHLHNQGRTLPKSIVYSKVRRNNRLKQGKKEKYKIQNRKNKNKKVMKWKQHNKQMMEKREWIVIDQNVGKYTGDIIDSKREICHCYGKACNPTTCYNGGNRNECYKKNCSTKTYCNNRRIQNEEMHDVKVSIWNGDKEAYCLLATQDIVKGEFVVEYKGKYVCITNSDEYMNMNHYYSHKINNEWVINSWKIGNEGSFANHDCNGNMESQVWEVNGQKKIILVASEDINAGDELTFDYGREYDLKGFKCSKQNCDRHE